MTLYIENETGEVFPFDLQETAELVCRSVLEEEGCPYETQINLVVTDNGGIRSLNARYRGIDRETDVLSFPNIDFIQEGNFQIEEGMDADYFDPDKGELVLGDIMICADRLKSQAESYGHSIKREFAFLTAHSMLHLCGYDHLEEEEARVMEEKQERLLTQLGITRD